MWRMIWPTDTLTTAWITHAVISSHAEEITVNTATVSVKNFTTEMCVAEMTTENRYAAGRNEDSLIDQQRKGDVIFYQVANKTCDKQVNTPVWWGWVSMKPTVSVSCETLCILSESLDSCRDHLDLTEGHPVHEVLSLYERCVWLPRPLSFVQSLICLRAAINLSSQSLWHPAINRSLGSSRPHLPPSLPPLSSFSSVNPSVAERIHD